MNKKSNVIFEIVISIFAFLYFYYNFSVKYAQILNYDKKECIFSAILLTFITWLLTKISQRLIALSREIRRRRIREK